MSRIMLIEDDEAIRIGLNYYLEEENFKIETFKDALEAIKRLNEDSNFDLILLDINLPEMDGFKAFHEIKKIKDIPIIFLTANDLEVTTVMGLEMGADDYITKPFKAKELTARIKTVLRRVHHKAKENSITIQNITIDMNGMKVLKNGKDVQLTALEYKILLILALNPNTVFTRETILADIWDVKEEYVNDNALTVYIKRIREKIEDDPTNPRIIQTVRGIGYKVGNSYE